MIRLVSAFKSRQESRRQSRIEREALEVAYQVRVKEVFGEVPPGTLLVFSQEANLGEYLSPEMKERLFEGLLDTTSSE